MSVVKILIIEDEHHLSDSIKEILSGIGEVHQAFDGDEGYYEAQQNIYDLIILDLMLPGMDGYEILSRLREEKIKTPVLILSAKDSIQDKVQGFEEGADDYLTKPFHREELLLRVRALLKRSIGMFDDNLLQVDQIEVNLATHAVKYGGTDIRLQGKEYDLFVYLLQNKNMIVTKEQIFDRIWGFDSETSITVVEVYMSNLRKQLKKVGVPNLIRTLRNVGYILEVDED